MSLSFSLTDDRGPSAALEITGHRVSAVRLESRAGKAVVVAHAVEALADGVVVPGLTSSNLRQRPQALAAVSKVLGEIGRPRRIGLIVADPVGKVSLVRFQQVPARGGELEQLIRWQVKKATPFPLDEAQISYSAGATTNEGREFLVSVARRDVVAEYEALCADAGAHAGIVDLSTFNVINAVLAGETATAGDWLLVNAAPEWASLAIVRGTDIILFRSRASEGEGSLADLVHQTSMYYEDRLAGAGFSRVLVCGAGGPGAEAQLEALRDTLRDRLHTAIELVDLRQAVTMSDRIAAGQPLLEALTPVVGLLLRSQVAA
jgi:type IV pilus assembly protein PilM